MSKSDTPRTDDFEDFWDSYNDPNEAVEAYEDAIEPDGESVKGSVTVEPEIKCCRCGRKLSRLQLCNCTENPGSSLTTEEKLDALSPESKQWLEKTCERFADGEGYDQNEAAIQECIAAGVIERWGKFIDVEAEVMGLGYSDSYFRKPGEVKP